MTAPYGFADDSLPYNVISGKPLSTILSGPVPPAGTRAVPSDVAGCTLEVASGGKWYGVLCNNKSQAWIGALLAEPGVAENLSTAGVYAWINNVRWVWNG